MGQSSSEKAQAPPFLALGPLWAPFYKTLATPVIKFMLISNKTSVISVGSNFFY